MSLTGTQTEKNLITSFVNESVAAHRYELFGKAASKEGHQFIGKLFAETAGMERQHANQFYGALQGGEVTITNTFPASVPGKARVADTITNLKDAIEGETHEYSVAYIDAAATARSEGFPEIAALFEAIAKAEEYHGKRFTYFLKKLQSNELYTSPTPLYWVCSNCGHIHYAEEAPEICPACNHPRGYFFTEGISYL
ncbi:hypothetical protein P9112_000517 [Eukaryota sp. TZLM1-RC]